MIITEKTKWATEYELDNDWVNMTITQCKDGKPIRKFYYIIPIEFYDDVCMWDWEVIPQYSHTPVISTKQHRMIKELTGIKKGGMLSLNMISPFMVLFKHKTMVSSKSNKQWQENDDNCLWYNAGYEDSEEDIVADEQWEQACRSFDIYIKREL